MNPWRPFPLIRLIIPFAAGNLAALLFAREIHIPFFLHLFVLLLFTGFVFIRKFSTDYRFRWMQGVIVFILIFLLSYDISGRKNELYFPSYFFRKAENGYGLFIAEIIEQPSVKMKTIKAVVRIRAVKSKVNWTPAVGKALLYIQKDSLSDCLQFGDKIVIRSVFHEPQPAAFPYSFDQKSYLERKHIHHMAFVGSGSWHILPDFDLSLQRFALHIRDRLLQILKENDVQGREFAVASALLLGYTDEIDRELIRDYSATGAMHILSVSGMHVGIIFLVLDRLLTFLKRSRKGVVLRTFLIIAMIWFYALLTGMSPAVMRASVMITFVVVAKAMKREPEILNILTASFIILILHDPTLLTDVGFEMSYLAVAGIVILYKPIYDLYVTSRYLPDKVWAILAVSLAAQLFTFPLGLFYFHQFPNYFMLANIIVVPLSSLIIYSGILLLFFGYMPVVSTLLAKALTGLVWIMNHSLHIIEEMPLSVTKGIFLTPLGTLLIYLALISMILFLFTRRTTYLFFFLGLTVIFEATSLIRSVGRAGSGAIIVYGTRNMAGIELLNGKRSILLYSEEAAQSAFFMENRQLTLYGLGVSREIRVMLRQKTEQAGKLAIGGWFNSLGRYLFFHGKRIGILDRKLPACTGQKIALDYLILHGNPAVSLREIRKLYACKEIIADPTNAPWRVRKWEDQAEIEGVRIFDVSKEGAYFKRID